MAARNPAEIRNVALVGHGGSGKTTLAERLLFLAGVVNRTGTVEDGSTVMDYTDEEKKHHHSLATGVAFLESDGALVNLLDTPGMGDFVGHAIASLPAAETVMVVVDAVKGIETVTRRMMGVAEERKYPTLIVVNKMDMSEADPEGVVEAVRDTFGSVCLPINLPTKDKEGVINIFEDGASGEPLFSSVEEAHTQIVDQVVEVDDDLMTRYLEEGAEGLDRKAIHNAFEKALRERHLIPICFTSGKTGAGAEDLLSIIRNYCPNPLEGNPRPFVRRSADGEETPWQAEPDPDKPALAHVFKVAADPFVGKLGVFRVHQGTMKQKSEVHIGESRKKVRIATLFKLRGKEHVEVDEVGPGDIAAVAKVEEVALGTTMHADGSDHIHLKPLPLPAPMFGRALELTNHKDEAKFGPATHKLMEEDPCFIVERVDATKETVARGLGELHLRIIFEKLKDQFGIEIDERPPRIAYKEAISAPAEGHHRHKKQSGGAGEFGEVFLRVAPLPDEHETGFEFENAVVGGNIPRNFMPAIEKGIRGVLADGAIAGYPLSGVRVEVYDGKHHPVDSKEVAFIKAGRMAFIDAVKKARPVIREPFVELEITAPSQYMGDITGDLSSKRGRVMDTEMQGSDMCVIKAQAPLSEVQNYSNELKSMTQGSGSFTMDYSHDEQAPPQIQQEVIAAFRPREEE